MTYTRAAIAWCLYALGHVMFLACDRLHIGFMYHPYKALMLASLHIQGRDNPQGPWERL